MTVKLRPCVFARNLQRIRQVSVGDDALGLSLAGLHVEVSPVSPQERHYE
jgi:hypothetical protein